MRAGGEGGDGGEEVEVREGGLILKWKEDWELTNHPTVVIELKGPEAGHLSDIVMIQFHSPCHKITRGVRE